MGVKLTTEEVIRRVKNTHGDTYDLSKFVYTTQRTKSIFICKLHGEFLSQPKEVWGGTGCPECGIEKFKPLSKWEDVKMCPFIIITYLFKNFVIGITIFNGGINSFTFKIKIVESIRIIMSFPKRRIYS
jgi:hypothetical protein